MKQINESFQSIKPPFQCHWLDEYMQECADNYSKENPENTEFERMDEEEKLRLVDAYMREYDCFADTLANMHDNESLIEFMAAVHKFCLQRYVNPIYNPLDEISIADLMDSYKEGLFKTLKKDIQQEINNKLEE